MNTRIMESFQRWPSYKAKYIKAIQKGIDTHPHLVVDGRETGEKLFDWWVYVAQGGKKKRPSDQTIMFE